MSNSDKKYQRYTIFTIYRLVIKFKKLVGVNKNMPFPAMDVVRGD